MRIKKFVSISRQIYIVILLKNYTFAPGKYNHIKFFKRMINRRLLRTKALQVIYAYYLSDNPSLTKSEKELIFAVDKTYELYYLLLMILVDLSAYAEERISIRKAKYFPTEEEANPNTRFLDNPVLNAIKNNEGFLNYSEKNKINWVNHPELVRNIYKSLIDHSEYNDYMEIPEPEFKDHTAILVFILVELIMPNELLHQILEERSIYWNDDLEFAGTMALKTIEGIKINQKVKFLPKYRHEEDREFLIELFRKTILMEEEMRELIKEYAKNWEFERIALMDVFIMQMALTEAMTFSSIPTKVTFNEYIEISKYYSTEKSSTFINGILDKAFTSLKENKQIVKKGRGLVGEI